MRLLVFVEVRECPSKAIMFSWMIPFSSLVNELTTGKKHLQPLASDFLQ